MSEPLSSVDDLGHALSQHSTWPPIRATLIRCNEAFRTLGKLAQVVAPPQVTGDRIALAAFCSQVVQATAEKDPGEVLYWRLVLKWPATASESSSEHRFTSNDPSAVRQLGDGNGTLAGAGRAGLGPLRADPLDDVESAELDQVDRLGRFADAANAERRHMMTMLLSGVQQTQAMAAGVVTPLLAANDSLTDENRRLRRQVTKLEAERDELQAQIDTLEDPEVLADAEARKAMGEFAMTSGAQIGVALLEHFKPGMLAKLGMRIDGPMRNVLSQLQPGTPLTAGQISMLQAAFLETPQPAAPNGAASH